MKKRVELISGMTYFDSFSFELSPQYNIKVQNILAQAT